MPSDAKRERSARRMRATVVRFGEEQFEELKAEAAFAGVSVAEYVRQAVVARIAHNAALRGEVPLAADGSIGAHARQEAQRVRSESGALRAESAQARAKSGAVHRKVHEDSRHG